MEQTPRRLLTAIAFVLAMAGSSADAQVIHVIDNQTQFNNLAITDGDKVVLRAAGTLNGSIQIQGLQDVIVTTAYHAGGLGSGSVGVGGSNTFVPAAVPTIDAGTSGLAIRIEQSQRIRIVGLRLQGGMGVQVVDSKDVQILGNEMRVVDGGVRVGNGLRTIVASNEVQPHPGTTHYHAFGVAILGGQDNLAFDNLIVEGIDTGIMVHQGAQRTALINNHIEDTSPGSAPFGPAFGIWDEGQNSCLVRNTAVGDPHPFLVGCQSTLIGNDGNPSGNSMVCNVIAPPLLFVENTL